MLGGNWEDHPAAALGGDAVEAGAAAGCALEQVPWDRGPGDVEEDGNEERGAGKAWRAARPGWGTRSGRRRRRSTTRGPRSRSKIIHR